MRMTTILILFLFPDVSAATVYPDLAFETEYPNLQMTSLTIPDTRYPDFNTISTPSVRVYVDGSNQFDHMAKFAACVPQIDFVVTLNVPDWVEKYPTYEWTGDDGERYYSEGTLVDFTKKFTGKNPSFSDRVQFDYIEAHDLGYPIRNGHWSVGSNWYPNSDQVTYHLLYHPNHSGKFSQTYLAGLSLNELKSLHDDDHEGRVKTRYVNKPAKQKIIVKANRQDEIKVPVQKTINAPPVTNEKNTYNLFNRKRTRRVYRARSGCPNGRCPT